jgi:hypothetical protein
LANEKNVLNFEDGSKQKSGDPDAIEEFEEDDPEALIREKMEMFQRDIDENDPEGHDEEDLLGKRAGLPEDKKKRLLE